jgi:hypothetical protein
LQRYHNVVAAPKEEADEEEVTPFMSFGD